MLFTKLKLIQKNSLLKKLIYSTFIILIIVIIFSFCFDKNTTNSLVVKTVEVKPATIGYIKQSISLIGTIQAKKSTIFTAKATGIVEKILDSGQKADKGDLIVKLENTDLEYSLQLSKDSAQIAQEQYDRNIILAKSNSISKKNLDETKTQWIVAQKALNDAKLALEQTKFIAPFTGIVGMYKVRDGMQVAQGEQIVAFFDPNELIVEFDIPATILNQLHDGQGVIIKKQHLHIKHIQKMVDPETNMSPAYVDYACQKCFIGENVDLDLIVAEKNNALIIPVSAVFLKDGKHSVYIVKNNQAILKHVELGLEENNNTEILDGIKEGDLIITHGQARLYPFSPVKILEEH